jgi:hypothetical protein
MAGEGLFFRLADAGRAVCCIKCTQILLSSADQAFNFAINLAGPYCQADFSDNFKINKLAKV